MVFFYPISYHFLIFLEDCSTSISLHLITLFIFFLNSLINGLSLYLLSLTALLNSYTNSSIVFDSCSIFFSSATFIDLLSSLPNSFLSLARKSLTDRNSIVVLFYNLSFIAILLWSKLHEYLVFYGGVFSIGFLSVSYYCLGLYSKITKFFFSSNLLLSKFFITFFFYISADSPYIYVNTY